MIYVLFILTAATTFALILALAAWEVIADRWAAYQDGARVAIADEDTDLTLAFISAIRDPLPGSVPCMEMQPVGAPLICGRGVAHRGHHIAFGNGHRIIATWAAGPRLRSVPMPRVAAEQDER